MLTPERGAVRAPIKTRGVAQQQKVLATLDAGWAMEKLWWMETSGTVVCRGPGDGTDLIKGQGVTPGRTDR